MLSFFTRSSSPTGDPLLNSKQGRITNNTKAGLIGSKFYKAPGPLEVEETQLERDDFLALVEKNATTPEGLSPEEIHQMRLYENLHGKTPYSRYEHIVKLYRSFIDQYKHTLETADLSTGRKFLEDLKKLNVKIKRIEQIQEFPETVLPPIPVVQSEEGDDDERLAGAGAEEEAPQIVVAGSVGGAGAAAGGGGLDPAGGGGGLDPAGGGSRAEKEAPNSPAAGSRRSLRNLALGPAMSRLNYNTRRRALLPGGSQRKTRRNGDKKRARNL